MPLIFRVTINKSHRKAKAFMKKFLLPILLLLATETLFSQLYTDWKWLQPKPQGNTLRYVKRWDANNWYAVGYGGTFIRTTDAGATWIFHHKAGRPGTDGATSFLYDAHFFNQSTGVVVGTGGIQRTTNAGVTFDTVANLPTAATWYQVFFLNNLTGYAAGTSSGRLAVTTDGGITWALNTIIASATYYDVWAYDKDTFYVSNSAGGVQKTTNAGLNFTLYSTGASAGLYKIQFINALTGYVAGASTFRLTTDGGATWTIAATGLPAQTFYDMDIVGSNIYLTGNSNYIYKTTNSGTTWDTLGFLADVGPQPWTSTYYASDFYGVDSLITGGAFGLLNRRNGSTPRTVHTNLLKPSTINNIWGLGNNVVALGAPSISGSVYDQIIYSTNKGTTWTISTFTSLDNKNLRPVFVSDEIPSEITKNTDEPLITTPLSTFFGIHMRTATTGYICGSNSAIYKTSNGGVSWDSVVTNIAAAQSLKDIFFLNANTGWTCQNLSTNAGSVWKTVDGGANWTQYTLTGQTGTAIRVYGISFVDTELGWAINYTPRPYKTTDGGATWTRDSIIDAFGGFMYDIQMLNASTGYICGSSGRIYKTTNGGALWDTLSKPVNNTWNALHFRDVNNGTVVGSNGAIIKTTNGGVSWTLANNGGSTLNAVYMLSNDSGYCAGSSGYTHRYGDYLVGGITWQNEAPSEYVLHQNYPNPFNPATTIKFSIPGKGIVSLKVYDVLGREVASLINNLELNGGTMTVDFDGSDLSSGVYFYSLVVDNNIQATKKMILVK